MFFFLLFLIRPSLSSHRLINRGKVALSPGHSHLHTFVNVSTVIEQHKALKLFVHKVGVAAKVKLSKEKHKDFVNKKINNAIMSLVPSDKIIERLEFMYMGKVTAKTDIVERGAALGILGSALGAIGTFVSIYNVFQIKSLRHSLEEEEAVSKQIIHSVSAMNNNINLNGKNIDHLMHSTKRILDSVDIIKSDVIVNEVFDQIFAKISLHNLNVHRFEVCLNGIQSGRLSLDLINVNHLIKNFNILKDKTNMAGRRLTSSDPRSVFKADISYIPENEGLSLFIHLESVETTFHELFEYVPFPFQVKNSWLQVKTEKRFLVVTSNFGMGAELSAGEMKNCAKREGFVMCEEIKYLQRTELLCLGAVFKNLHLHSVCDFHLLPSPGQDAFKISEAKHLIFSPFHDRAFIKCLGNSHYEPLLEGNATEVHLKSSCEMRSKQLFVPAHHGTEVTTEASNILELPSFFEPSYVPPTELIDLVLPELKRERGFKSVDLKDLQQAVEGRRATEDSWLRDIGLAIVLGLVFVMVFLICVHLYNKLKKEAKS